MNTTARQQIDNLLMQRDFERVLDLCQMERQALKALQRNLYSIEEKLLWPAIEAIAVIMETWWLSGDEEKVREYIRKLLWSINDESGGIGWNAPQTIAETIVRIPELVDPYGSIIIDRTMKEPLLVQNGLWAIGRLGRRIESDLGFFKEVVLENFESDNPHTLALAAWAMGEAAFKPALPMLESLRMRPELVRIYIDGKFCERTIGRWAEDAIAKI